MSWLACTFSCARNMVKSLWHTISTRSRSRSTSQVGLSVDMFLSICLSVCSSFCFCLSASLFVYVFLSIVTDGSLNHTGSYQIEAFASRDGRESRKITEIFKIKGTSSTKLFKFASSLSPLRCHMCVPLFHSIPPGPSNTSKKSSTDYASTATNQSTNQSRLKVYRRSHRYALHQLAALLAFSCL
jgi:hypothetical protein